MAALILVVGALLAAGIVLAGAPWLTERWKLHPIVAARVALTAGIVALCAAGGAAWTFWAIPVAG